MSAIRLVLLARAAGRSLAKLAATASATPAPPAPSALRAPAVPSAGNLARKLAGPLGWKGNLAIGAGVLGAASLLGRARRRPNRPHLEVESPPVHGTGALPMSVNAWGVPTLEDPS
jgi:hypothetical protein